LGIIPPNIVRDFDENTNWDKAIIIAYEEIREHEESQAICPLMGSK
jgi:hypothetical protein